MKKNILILMFVLFFALPISSLAEEKPADEAINAALVTSIKNRNHELRNWKIEILKKYFHNEYVLKKDGETVYCYDVECVYRAESLPIDIGHRDILELVKRGEKWYLY